MLKSDGIGRETFLVMWRDAMWSATDPAERARLVLELARVDLREFGRVAPLLVAVLDDDAAPVQLVDLSGVTLDSEDALRVAVRERLGPLGPLEVYLAFAAAAGERQGVPHFLLVVWGEAAVPQAEVCWLKPYRVRGEQHVDEAPELQIADPQATVYAPLLTGLLPRRH